MEKKNSAGAFLTVKDEIQSPVKPTKMIPWIQGVVQNEGAVRSAGNTKVLAARSFCRFYNTF